MIQSKAHWAHPQRLCRVFTRLRFFCVRNPCFFVGIAGTAISYPRQVLFGSLFHSPHRELANVSRAPLNRQDFIPAEVLRKIHYLLQSISRLIHETSDSFFLVTFPWESKIATIEMLAEVTAAKHLHSLSNHRPAPIGRFLNHTLASFGFHEKQIRFKIFSHSDLRYILLWY
jgi:hypothetical protein